MYFASSSQVGQKIKYGEGTRYESRGRKRKQNTGDSTRHTAGGREETQ